MDPYKMIKKEGNGSIRVSQSNHCNEDFEFDDETLKKIRCLIDLKLTKEEIQAAFDKIPENMLERFFSLVDKTPFILNVLQVLHNSQIIALLVQKDRSINQKMALRYIEMLRKSSKTEEQKTKEEKTEEEKTKEQSQTMILPSDNLSNEEKEKIKKDYSRGLTVEEIIQLFPRIEAQEAIFVYLNELKKSPLSPKEKERIDGYFWSGHITVDVILDMFPKNTEAVREYLSQLQKSTLSSQDKMRINRFLPLGLTMEEIIQAFPETSLHDAVRKYITEIKAKEIDSRIIKDSNETKLIKEWIGKGSKVQLNLLYRGSCDGFEAKAFHSKCDNQGATITVVESTGNKRFGGYNNIDWRSGVNKYENSTECFLFSLDSKERLSYFQNPESTIYNRDNYGPTWGGGHDLSIADASNTNSNSYSNLGYTYKKFNNGGASLAESAKFTVKEIEVFAVSI